MSTSIASMPTTEATTIIVTANPFHREGLNRRWNGLDADRCTDVLSFLLFFTAQSIVYVVKNYQDHIKLAPKERKHSIEN